MLNKNTWGIKSENSIRSSNTIVCTKINEGGQVIKPIILVKICYKLLYVIQGIKNIDKVTSWPQLISKLLAVCIAASDWPHTYLHPRCFCLAYCSYTFNFEGTINHTDISLSS